MSLNHYLTKRLTAMYDDPLTSREQFEAEDMERQDDWAEAQHTALLESYCRKLWEATRVQYRMNGPSEQRTPAHRLEVIARRMHNVDRYGVKNDIEAEYQMDLLLTEWGAGKLMGYFAALAETEGQ